MKLNMVLRHELMHIRHKDYLLHHLFVMIKIFFWFHPLTHLLFRQILDYREMRIDSHVLLDSSISKKRYASVLLELIPFNNFEQSAAAPTAVGMARESSNLKKRVEKMKNQKKRHIPVKLSITSFSAVLVIFALFMACTDLQQHNESNEPLAGANITVKSLSSTGTATDRNGKFKIDNIPPGEQEFEISYIGYARSTFRYDVK